MKLKYVGDMPVVSKTGIAFDHTKPDKYSYLSAAAELLEALSYGPTETTSHLYQTPSRHLSDAELKKILTKHIKDIDALIDQQEQKAHAYVTELIERVHENESLNADERRAWLENIKLMQDYFYQYIANQTAYEAALEALSEEIHAGVIKEVCVPMFKNYVIILNDLREVLERSKSPLDSDIKIEEKDGELHGTLCITHY